MAIATTAALILPFCTHGAPQQLPRTILIFIDVSGSIQPSQFEAMKQQLREIVTSLESRTGIEIYPLDANAHAPADRMLTRGLAHTTSVRELAKLDSFLKALDKTRDPASTNERQSCILNSLRHARDRVQNLTEQNRSVELVYISDMLEDCSSNDTNAPIHFSPRVSDKEVKQAFEHVRKLVGRGEWLRGARFTAILPPKVSATSLEPLDAFWREVMSMHGAHVSSSREPVLLTSIPVRLQTSRGRTP